MIKVGQKVVIDPFKDAVGFASELSRGRIWEGTVVYVNAEHKWFSVEYGRHKLLTSYKFSQIGEDVQLQYTEYSDKG